MVGADYVPPVDLERFPRHSIYYPNSTENPLGAWAWKCSIKDSRGPSGLLKGKTIVIKDCVAIEGVPFLLGTNFFKDYTPVRNP